MKRFWNIIDSFLNEFNTWLILISFVFLIVIKIIVSIASIDTVDAEKEIRNIHFSGIVIEKGTKRGTYYLDFEGEKRIYLPNHQLMMSFYKKLEVGSKIRKRRYFNKIKVKHNEVTQYYKYPKNRISFVRNNFDDYSN